MRVPVDSGLLEPLVVVDCDDLSCHFFIAHEVLVDIEVVDVDDDKGLKFYDIEFVFVIRSAHLG